MRRCFVYSNYRGGTNYAMQSSDTYYLLARYFDLTQQELSELRSPNDPDRHEPLWNNMVQWARNDLRKRGFLDIATSRGMWRLSGEGIAMASALSCKYSKLKHR